MGLALKVGAYEAHRALQIQDKSQEPDPLHEHAFYLIKKQTVKALRDRSL